MNSSLTWSLKACWIRNPPDRTSNVTLSSFPRPRLEFSSGLLFGDFRDSFGTNHEHIVLGFDAKVGDFDAGKVCSQRGRLLVVGSSVLSCNCSERMIRRTSSDDIFVLCGEKGIPRRQHTTFTMWANSMVPKHPRVSIRSIGITQPYPPRPTLCSFGIFPVSWLSSVSCIPADLSLTGAGDPRGGLVGSGSGPGSEAPLGVICDREFDLRRLRSYWGEVL